MSTAFKVPVNNVPTSAATPKQGTWGSAVTIASATNLENIKSLRGSLTVQHAGGFTYNAPATLLAVAVDAWISGAWQTVYTTGVEGAPALSGLATSALNGPPLVLKDGSGSLTETLEFPTINLAGANVATGKRIRALAFGPASGNFNISGELHGAPNTQL